MTGPVAIIDIGSNSIKILVAQRTPDGQLVALQTRTIDARISTGIGAAQARLAEEGMLRGLAAIQELLALAAPHAPTTIQLVATSAVRDATNGGEFCERVRAATGHPIRILNGDEEANLIGRGLTADPALTSLQDFYVFDLGGGSLECLAFVRRKIAQAHSSQLGCVRLTERFVRDIAAPVDPATQEAVMTHVRMELQASPFQFSLSATAAAVFTGGSMTTARAILGARQGLTLEASPAAVATNELHTLLDQLASLPLADRRTVPGLPPARADVFPVALATMIAVADLAGSILLHHSLYNLRWGLANELMDKGA